MKRPWRWIAWLTLAALAYLALWPTPIAPQAWHPPQAPAAEGPYAPNDELRRIERFGAPGLIGPECIEFDASGRLYTGYVGGKVMRYAADGSDATELADTGGRPLCVRVLGDGTMIVTDAVKGLLRIAPGGVIEVLADGHAGVRFRLTDDVVVSADGRTAYFTDASSRFGVDETLLDVLEHGANGRLLRIDLDTRKTTLLLGDLHFANGVVLGPDEQFLLVSETSSYRILRYWLAGARAGTHEVFADNLPGFPDNLTSNGRDRYWVALFNPRNALLDRIGPYPFLRKVVERLPQFARPQPVRHAFVVGLDFEGRPVESFQHLGADAYAPVTTAREHEGWLYLGSLEQGGIARFRLAGR